MVTPDTKRPRRPRTVKSRRGLFCRGYPRERFPPSFLTPRHFKPHSQPPASPPANPPKLRASAADPPVRGSFLRAPGRVPFPLQRGPITRPSAPDGPTQRAGDGREKETRDEEEVR